MPMDIADNERRMAQLDRQIDLHHWSNDALKGAAEFLRDEFNDHLNCDEASFAKESAGLEKAVEILIRFDGIERQGTVG